MNVYLLILFVIVFIYIIVFWLLFKKYNSRVNNYLLLLFVTTFFALLWSVSIYFALYSETEIINRVLSARLTFAFSTQTQYFFMFFAIFFVNAFTPKWKAFRKIFIPLLIISFLINIGLTYLTLFTDGVVISIDNESFHTVYGQYKSLINLYYLSSVLMSLMLFFIKFIKEKDLIKLKFS
mgnify:CR=1 FL=1